MGIDFDAVLTVSNWLQAMPLFNKYSSIITLNNPQPNKFISIKSHFLQIIFDFLAKIPDRLNFKVTNLP